MRIVFLVYRYWPAVGGVEKYVHDLGKALIAMGHEVDVVAGAHVPGLAEHERRDGIDIHRYPAYRSPARRWWHLFRLRPVFQRADVIHISDVLMVETYRRVLGWSLPGRPVFMTRHGLSFRCPVPDLEKRRAARAAKWVRGVIDDGYFIAKWLGVPADAVLDQGLSPAADEIEQTLEPTNPGAVYVGRLGWDGGITHYVDAVRVLKKRDNLDFPLDVYGGGELEDELKQAVARDALPVRFHGWVDDAQAHLGDAMFAFVSGRMAIQEAMARRRLVVATYVNELKKDYVFEEPFSPYLTIAETGSDIADLVLRYWRHADQRREIVEQAFAHARTLTWRRTAQGCLDMWKGDRQKAKVKSQKSKWERREEPSPITHQPSVPGITSPLRAFVPSCLRAFPYRLSLFSPSVSIVVPTFNRREYLPRMIDSIRAQTYTDWELIIVDGQSKDGTADLIRDYQETLGNKLVFIEQPNQGCCVARNTGIDAARGRYVALLDSDDEFLPIKLERQMELFKRRPELGFVYCDYSFIDTDGRFHRSVFDEMARVAREVPYDVVAPGLHVCAPDLFDYLIRQYFISTIVGVVRREVLADDIRFLEHDMYGCEWMFYLDIVRRCRAGYVDEPLCLHHHVAGSLSRTSAMRNSLYHRSLLKIMQRRFTDCSALARGEMSRQIADTCLQLGFDSQRHAEHGPATRYFAEVLKERLDGAAAKGLVTSAMAWLLSWGCPGNEPLLRVDPHRGSDFG